MKIDITYRVIHRNQRKFLRVRVRAVKGMSAVCVYPDTAAFMARATSCRLDSALEGLLYEDIDLLRTFPVDVHYRKDVDVNPETLAALGIPALESQQEFDLSFSREVGQDSKPGYRLFAKEWNVSGRSAIEVSQVFSNEEIADRLHRVDFDHRDVRDRQLPGSRSKRKLTEDEVEVLFDPTKLDEEADDDDLGIAFEI